MADEATKSGEGEPEKKPAETTEEKTVSEIIDATVPPKTTPEGDKKPDVADPEMVPLSSLMEFKKENKEFKQKIKELEAAINSGDTSKDDVSEELDALAKEFDIDPQFVNKLAKIFDAKADKKIGETTKPILERDEKITKKERDDLIDKAFTTHYTSALEKMPEYKDIANADVIKQLSLLPANAKKTFPQLIEETYGKAIPGKHTIETTTPGGGKDPDPIDFDRARKDTSYFQEIMADPVRKAEYNKRLVEPNRRRS